VAKSWDTVDRDNGWSMTLMLMAVSRIVVVACDEDEDMNQCRAVADTYLLGGVDGIVEEDTGAYLLASLDPDCLDGDGNSYSHLAGCRVESMDHCDGTNRTKSSRI
jgi:hypothetical protein